MSGVNIEYKGESIATIPDTGSKTIKTQGKYCEGDILIEYEAPPTPSPTLQSKTVTPTTSQQSVTPDSGYDGLSDVTVNATPLEAKTVTPTSQQQVVTPTAPNIGLSSVTVGAAPQPTLITKQITANGTYAAEDDNADGYSEVEVAVSVPAPVEEKDVNFYDYDGTVLYAYTFAEAMALASLPQPPSHDGLISQGWTHSLEEIQSSALSNRFLDVGALYITDDGKTRLYFTIESRDSPHNVSFYAFVNSGTVTISVNGEVVSTIRYNYNYDSSSLITFSFPTAESYPANYLVELSYVGSRRFGIGGGTNYYNSAYSFLNKVEMGECAALHSGAFMQCSKLETISTTRDCVFLDLSMGFSECASLKAVFLHGSFTRNSIYNLFSKCVSLTKVIVSSNDYPSDLSGSYVFEKCSQIKKLTFSWSLNNSSYAASECRSLKTIVLGETTTIPSYAFHYCSLLEKVDIPNTVTLISSYAFYKCYLLRKVDLSSYVDPSNIPSLQNTSAFTDTQQNKVFLVANQEMLDAFASATNWSSFASNFRIKGATT